MNWKTKQILEDAKREISDGGIFSDDQIAALRAMLAKVGEAIDHEGENNKPAVPLDY